MEGCKSSTNSLASTVRPAWSWKAPHDNCEYCSRFEPIYDNLPSPNYCVQEGVRKVKAVCLWEDHLTESDAKNNGWLLKQEHGAGEPVSVEDTWGGSKSAQLTHAPEEVQASATCWKADPTITDQLKSEFHDPALILFNDMSVFYSTWLGNIETLQNQLASALTPLFSCVSGDPKEIETAFSKIDRNCLLNLSAQYLKLDADVLSFADRMMMLDHSLNRVINATREEQSQCFLKHLRDASIGGKRLWTIAGGQHLDPQGDGKIIVEGLAEAGISPILILRPVRHGEAPNGGTLFKAGTRDECLESQQAIIAQGQRSVWSTPLMLELCKIRYRIFAFDLEAIKPTKGMIDFALGAYGGAK